MPNELTSIYCPQCDRLEQGRTQSRMLNKQSGYVCTGMGHRFKSYIALMDMHPRMEKLLVQEKQPAGTDAVSFWVHPAAYSALQSRFPSNLRTTICALFNALSDPETILIEGEHTRELRSLGIARGRDMVGLARTNIALTEQLKLQTEQMKQYELVAKLLNMAGGGGGLAALVSPAAASATTEALTAAPTLPPRAPVVPPIDTDAEFNYYADVAPGSFGDPSLARPTPAVVLGKPGRAQ